jgi:Tol biopolymer transport system component
MIGRTLSRYRIVSELGQGGMGVVCKAEDLRLGRSVALKFLPDAVARDREALDRFGREARAASALNHPHICTIHDIDEHEGKPFIVMELLEGATLRQRIAGRPLDLDTVLDLTAQIAEALAAAHAKGIIHRDVKSANIFVTDTGQAKILDFGLAKLVAGDGQHAAERTVTSAPLGGAPQALRTSPGQTMGTVAYMSPEQVRGLELDARTDIFSLGVVIYEMLTGTLPFQGATDGVIFDAILNRPPAPLAAVAPAVPAELLHILDKALEKDRELRYQSARELRADVARLKRDSGTLASGISVPAVSATTTQPRRRRLAAVAAAVAVLLIAIAGYLAWPLPGPAAPAAGAIRLARLTFDEGLQTQPTWSPDGRFIAYSSNQSGSFDIWVQPVGGGRAVQVTTDPAVDWQPAWSPDGDTLAFRSERNGGGIFLVPALGGRERLLAPFGYAPDWSPDGSKVLAVLQAPLASASEVIPHLFLLDPAGGAPMRILEPELAAFSNVARIFWHPDGRRISFFGIKDSGRAFWTAPIAGGPAVRSEVGDDVTQRIREQLTNISAISAARWAPSGDAIYLEATAQRVVNLWKVEVDPRTLRWIGGPTRLTTGLGPDGHVAVSSDGKKIAFVTSSETSRLWSLPFDARRRQVAGEGTAITPANMTVSGFDLSPNGRLVYIAARPGKAGHELWAGSIDGGTPVLLSEAFLFFGPRLTRDGLRVGYRIRESQAVPRRVKWRPVAGGAEHAMTEGTSTVWDWSPDGARLLHSCPPPNPPGALCISPATATTNDAARQLVADAAYQLWQGRFSPDGAWVLFNAQSRAQPGVSILGVVPAAGGRWVPLTDAKLWSDKARWGPDGRSIHFISNRDSAFFDVWTVAFDPAKGALVGTDSRVTRYENPGRLVSASGLSELGVTGTHLVLPITETTGSVWVLDGVRR